MAIAADTRSPRFSYAMTQWFLARAKLTPPSEIRLSPALDMLGVRYVIFRGSPPASIRPAFEGDDYWVMVNQRALPRVFVPKQVKTVADDLERLAKLTLPQFNPREIAYVESAVDLPPSSLGAATIVEETPRQIKVSARMHTAGLLVLADLWDPGWEAYVNGRRVPILRTNHAVRGVEVPAGSVLLEFRHEPRSFLVGLKLSALVLLALMVWLGSALWRRRSTETASNQPGRDPRRG